jgi:hypothetical protein
MMMKKIKMGKKEDIVVYWAPGIFNVQESSWNALYSDPTPLFQELLSIRDREVKWDANIFLCPAFNKTMKNTFIVKSTIDDEFNLPTTQLNMIESGQEEYIVDLDINSKVQLRRERKSVFSDFFDLAYNMGWILFCEEPLSVTFTAPHMPHYTPMEGAILVPGEMDIGKWFRPYLLDYFVPKTTTKFQVKAGQPLMYININTDRNIVLKRFTMNDTLTSMATEFSKFPRRYGRKLPLEDKYRWAKDTKMLSIVSREIKKNLID